MADYQRIVEFLRDFRLSPIQRVTDEVRQYAAQYAQLCEQANERLRQCSVFLQQGLRSEAIHLAEESPNLLDLVAALDLPDPQAWAEFCQQYDIPVPPPLQLDRAAQLDEAYNRDQSLEQLMDRHRLLALRRAPISWRLQVLRQIREMDPTSPFWDEDVRVLEKARIRELSTELPGAVDRGSVSGITGIYSELNDEPWLEEVPHELLETSTTAWNRIRAAQARKTIGRLRPQLRDAFAEKNLAETSRLLTEIRQVAEEDGDGTMPVELANEIKPMVAWVKQEEQLQASQRTFTNACRELSELLDADAATPRLESAVLRLVEMGHPIPPQLQERYDQRLAQRRQQASRTYRVRLAAVAATLVVLLLAGATFVLLSQRTSSAQHWAAQINQAVDARDLALAQQHVQTVSEQYPQVAGTSEVAAARQRVEALRGQHQQDTETLNLELAHYAQMRQTLASALNSESLETLLDAAGRARQTLQRAQDTQRLEWVDSQRQLSAARHELAGLQDQFHDRIATIALARVGSLRQEVEQAGGNDVATALQAAGAQLPMLNRAGQVVPRLSNPVEQLAQQIEQRRTALQQASTHQEQLRGIIAAAGSADALAAALREHVQRNPESPVAADFARAADAAELGAGVEQWNRLAGAWRGRYEATTPRIATQRAMDIGRYMEEYPRSPMLIPARNYQTYLERAAAALAPDGAWQQAFADLLASPMISELSVLQTSDGRSYYVLGEPRLVPSRVGDQVSWRFEAVDPANLAQRITVRIDPPVELVSERPTPAPHARLAADIGHRIRTFEAANWDTFGIDLVEMIRGNRQVEPVVQAILLLQAMRTAVEVAPWGLSDVYDKAIADLARHDVENLVWYDPARPVPDAARSALAAIVADIPDGSTARQRLLERRTQLFAAVHPSTVGTGVLLRNTAGEWEAHTSAQPEAGRALVAVRAGAGQRPATLVTVARVRDGRFALIPTVVAALPEGTLLFVQGEQ